MDIPIFTVDAFTNVPFKGNPAAVCLMENVSITLSQDYRLVIHGKKKM